MKRRKDWSVSLPLLAFLCLQFCSQVVSTDFDLDSEVLYTIEWPGGNIEQTLEPPVVEVLPGEVLGEGVWERETVVMSTGGNEHYTCLLPGEQPVDGSLAVGEELGDLLSPEYLLKPIRNQCTRLLMAYWNYELCHWNYLRQYHEEKLEDGQVKIDEYILGQYENAPASEATPTEQEVDTPPSKEKVPVIPIQGREYGYYPVAMAMGTPCDLKNNEPRSVEIKYICDQDSYKYGTLLRVDEVTTCNYEALVSTPQLCQDQQYRLKEQPIQSIKCYPKGGSPKKPRALLEQEIFSSDLKSSHLSETQESSEKPYRKEIQSRDVQLDDSFVKAFLSGETCLRGGTGWWLHELCYGEHVKQLHFDQSGERTEVALGYWQETEHAQWYKKTGYKKQIQTQVVHLYKGGDVCELTGLPRQCHVKYKCVTSGKGSTISLFLEEPTACSYSLTVEGAFLCPLLESTDQYGVFSGSGAGNGHQDKDSHVEETVREEVTSTAPPVKGPPEVGSEGTGDQEITEQDEQTNSKVTGEEREESTEATERQSGDHSQTKPQNQQPSNH